MFIKECKNKLRSYYLKFRINNVKEIEMYLENAIAVGIAFLLLNSLRLEELKKATVLKLFAYLARASWALVLVYLAMTST